MRRLLSFWFSSALQVPGSFQADSRRSSSPLVPLYYSTLSQNEKESTWANVKRLNPARRSRLAEHVVYTDSVVDALCAETLALLSGSYNARLADETALIRS